MEDKIVRKKAQDRKDQGNRRDKKKAEGKRALTVFVSEEVHEALGRLCRGRKQSKEEFLTHLIMECDRILTEVPLATLPPAKWKSA